MKRLLFLAPGVKAPLTEGRKLFVTDLAATLREQEIGVEVLTGSQAGGGATAIFQVVRELRVRLSHKTAPEAVALFPYGTFGGMRGWVNRYLIYRVRRLCERTGTPVLPVFYSCAGLEMRALERRFAPALAVGTGGFGIQALRLGIRQETPSWKRHDGALHELLFLCGYQENSARALDDVLHVRGLIDLLRVGQDLAGMGLRLSVAIPFLRYDAMRDRVRRLQRKLCPQLEIRLLSEGKPSDLLATHHAFVFPYRGAHSVFIPTSLLEAMSIGIPVLAADQAMYRSLTQSGSQWRCRVHRAADPQDLLMNMQELAAQYPLAQRLAAETSGHVKAVWTIEHSAKELLSAFGQVGTTPEAGGGAGGLFDSSWRR